MTIVPHAFVVSAVGLSVIGCSGRRGSAVSHGDRQDWDASFDLTPYFPAAVRAERTYVRTNPARREGPPFLFVQTEDEHGRAGGSLTGRLEWPLSRYLDPHSDRSDRPIVKWPSPPRKGSEAFFVEFDPPIAEWPAGLRAGGPVEWRAKMTAYDRYGVPFAQGSAARRVWWEGSETIEANGASFADCVRLRAETDLYLGWWASFRLRETVWLGERVGVVRRVERLSGRALLLLRFDSSHQYVLQGAEADLSSAEASPALPRRWARLAIHLDRSLPRPRVGGLAVEWARESDGESPPSANAGR
jgi:hypothetical protein